MSETINADWHLEKDCEIISMPKVAGVSPSHDEIVGLGRPQYSAKVTRDITPVESTQSIANNGSELRHSVKPMLR